MSSGVPKIIALDFDGCLVRNNYPDIGVPIYKNIIKVKEEIANGSKIILWTNRAGEHLDAAIKFCYEHDIQLDAINENLPEIIEQYGNDSRKIFATEFWDDRAVLMNEHVPEQIIERRIRHERRCDNIVNWDDAITKKEYIERKSASQVAFNLSLKEFGEVLMGDASE